MFHNHINYVSKLQITTIITKSIPSEKSACSLYDCTTYSTQEASSESQSFLAIITSNVLGAFNYDS